MITCSNCRYDCLNSRSCLASNYYYHSEKWNMWDWVGFGVAVLVLLSLVAML
ncbi:unnamed protein product [marine sediment metagenome]|uniref:Uncharacterized protein n=1 Tax=marine sediment metagenome TaxID=412755 RepID=X1BDS4_9ZZZZ